MTYHVGIREIQAYKINRSFFQFVYDGIGDTGRAHFRLKIISRYFRRRNQDPVFAFKGIFPAAGKEKGDMRIFFCLRDTDLFFARLAKHFAERHGQVVFFINHVYVFKRIVVIRHGDIMKIHFMHVLLRKIFLSKSNSNLTAPIGAEVEANHHITFLNCCQWFLIFIY